MAINASRIYHILVDKNKVECPKVLSYDSQSITYQYLFMGKPMNDISFYEHKLYLPRIGELLKCINSQNCHHGDFVLHNIFIKECDTLQIIDSNVPELLSFDTIFYKNDLSLDFYTFVNSYLSDIGLKKVVCNFLIIRNNVRLFQRNYVELDDSIYTRVKALFIIHHRVYLQKRLSNFTRLHSILHILVSFIFCLIIIYGNFSKNIEFKK